MSVVALHSSMHTAEVGNADEENVLMLNTG
jgi:hypothetical protein